jgi:hypothetical protein
MYFARAHRSRELLCAEPATCRPRDLTPSRCTALRKGVRSRALASASAAGRPRRGAGESYGVAAHRRRAWLGAVRPLVRPPGSLHGSRRLRTVPETASKRIRPQLESGNAHRGQTRRRFTLASSVCRGVAAASGPAAFAGRRFARARRLTYRTTAGSSSRVWQCEPLTRGYSRPTDEAASVGVSAAEARRRSNRDAASPFQPFSSW